MLATDWPVSEPNEVCQWEIGYLRATTFIPDLSMEGAVGNTWWEEAVGGKPENEHIDHQKGVKEQKGTLNGNLLVMVSQPGRIDWTLEATEEGSSEPSKLPTVGSMSGDALEPFVGIVKNWLNRCPPTNRLAFGTILGRLVADAQAGYEEIQPYLHNVRLNPQGISDFFYQINRPKESTVNQGIRINRLSKWSVALVGTVGITIDPAASKASASMIQRRHICRLELDINTAALSDAVSGDDAYAIFQELIEHGQDIASKGDAQ